MSTDQNEAINQQQVTLGEPAPTNQGKPAEKMFTQSEVNGIVQERLKDFADYKDLKKRASDLELAQGTWDQARQGLEGNVKTATERANKATIGLELYKAAAKARFTDPSDVFGAVDMSKITIADDGKISGIEEAIQALAESKPHWIQGEPAKSTAVKLSATNPGGTGATLTREALSKMSEKEIMALDKEARDAALRS